MKLFDVSQSVLDAVKTAMETPIVLDESLKDYKHKHVQGLYNYEHFEHPNGSFVQVGGNPQRYIHQDKNGNRKEFDSLTALKNHINTHNEEAEALDERNKENKFKKDLHVVNKAIDFDKKNLGIMPKDVNMLSKDYGHDTDTKRENMKALLKSYKKTGRYLTKNEEVETVSEVRDPGSTFGVSTPLKTKGKYVSDDGRHVAKVRRDKDYDEFRVEIHSDGVHNKNADYHTDDKEDAHDTAKAMLAHAVKHAKPLGEETEVSVDLVSKIINKYNNK